MAAVQGPCDAQCTESGAKILKSSQAMVSSIVRTILPNQQQESAKEQLAVVVQQLKSRFPKAMDVLQKAEEDVLAYMAFPNFCSTNPLERLNREIRRGIDVVGIFPNRDSVIRLVGTILQYTNDACHLVEAFHHLTGHYPH